MKRSAAVLIAVVVLISVLIWAGVHNGRSRREAMQKAQENRAVLQPGSAGPQMGAGEVDGDSAPKLEGKAAPAFTVMDLSGKKVSLADYKGKPVIVNFWATWCAPCKLEMPWFEEFRAKYKDSGLEILGVSMDDDTVSKEEIAKTAKKAGVTYPILLGDDKTGKLYGGIEYLPMSFYVDKGGKVIVQTAGLGGKDQVEAAVQKLLAASK